jgi:TM2 domain-containing membrane protein YozV
MRHAGLLQFEDEGAEPRAEGSIDFTGEAVLLRVGDQVVAEVLPAGLVVSTLGDGRHRLSIGGESLIFEPADSEAFDRELTAHAYAARLSPSQMSAAVPPSVPAGTSAPIVPAMVNPPKSPGVAAVLSFLWPGLGQIYNGEGLKAVLFISAQIVNFFLTFVVIGFFTGFVVWVWAMIDAYKGSEAYNRRQVAFPGS